MYHPTTRVLTTLELLQAHPQLSGADLAARLEVDRRTVRRYVTMLQDLGIPVEAERGRHGGYRLRPGFKLPPMVFTDDEALALTLGLLTARRLGLPGAVPAVEGALAKVDRVLPPVVRQRVDAVRETLITDIAPALTTPSGAIVSTIGEAVRARRRVRLRYASWRGEETERDIDPYGLVYLSSRWFTVGHCHLRRDLRVFRLDRVLDATCCTATFDPPPEFDALAYVSRSLVSTPAAWSVEVRLETTLAEARAMVPPDFASVDEEDAGILLRSSVSDLDWFAHRLLGLGCSFVVHEPVELRAALLRLAARAAAATQFPPGAA